MTITSYQDLEAWQFAMELVEDVYRSTQLFPRSELYGLTSQIRRCAISIASNLAEGHERRSRADFARFAAIALGSTAELETQIVLAERLTYLDTTGSKRLLAQADRIGRMVRGLHRSLQR